MDKGSKRESAWLGEADKRLFPLTKISSIVRLFKQQLESSDEPDLALLSIVAGAVENTLTCNRTLPKCDGDDRVDTRTMSQILLTAVEFKTVQALYMKFHSIIKGSVDITQFNTKFATRELVKKVSDVIWHSLTRSYYKDRAHMQSLYSYLTGNKLDCFGVAFAVVAGCQVLGFNDVHLALAEDHAWVVFGQNGEETAEVTWHGKGNEDKRGQPIGPGMSWLYVNGCPIICTRAMEVAAVVTAIHPSLNATTDCTEVAVLQQELSWILYDLGHLTRYPMGLGNLADLEDICPTPGRPPCSTLFDESTSSARTYYNNQHVYPHTFQGGYFYKHKMYKEALECWANAADVIRMYNYTRDDEEIYKELLEIANELIPHIIKSVSSGHSAHSILKDPNCFAYLLRFYDGICQWEEGSATPVLHIGWAKPLVNTISKFDAEVRAKVIIEEVDTKDEDTEKVLTVWWEGSNTNLNPYKKEYINNNNHYKNRENGPTNLHTLESKLRKEEKPHPSIAALTMACGEKILNREYLLGGREPFVASDAPGTSASANEERPRALPEVPPNGEVGGSRAVSEGGPRVILRSQKMKGLKDLLLAEKLNTQAISLQLTAQSQVQVVKTKRGSLEQNGQLRPKRARRD